MKRIFSLLAVCLLMLSMVLSISACKKNEMTNTVVFEIEGFGEIVIELYPRKAPATVYNFQCLVAEGFYDGLTFHRIVPGFVIQGGDPKGDGTGNSGKTIPGEFSSNGFTGNDLKHVRGTVSMARGNSNDSASCQFFIVLETSLNNTRSLDGNYAAFGQVIEGMDVVDAIAAVATNASDAPIQTVKIVKATFR